MLFGKYLVIYCYIFIFYSLENEKEKVEKIITSIENYINLLKEVFMNAGDHQLINLLDSLLKILNASIKINQELGQNNEFIEILKGKLHHPNPHARVALLKTLTSICLHYKERHNFLKNHHLSKIVKFMAKQDNAIFVKQIAESLLKEGK